MYRNHNQLLYNTQNYKCVIIFKITIEKIIDFLRVTFFQTCIYYIIYDIIKYLYSFKRNDGVMLNM